MEGVMKINYFLLIDSMLVAGLLYYGYLIFGCIVQVKKEAFK